MAAVNNRCAAGSAARRRWSRVADSSSQRKSEAAPRSCPEVLLDVLGEQRPWKVWRSARRGSTLKRASETAMPRADAGIRTAYDSVLIR